MSQSTTASTNSFSTPRTAEEYLNSLAGQYSLLQGSHTISGTNTCFESCVQFRSSLEVWGWERLDENNVHNDKKKRQGQLLNVFQNGSTPADRLVCVPIDSVRPYRIVMQNKPHSDAEVQQNN